MDELNKIIFRCAMAENNLFNINQGGITYKNKFFYETRSDSKIFIFEYVVSGQGYIICNDKLYTLKAGDFYIIPTGKTYEYFTDSNDPYERMWFYGTGRLYESLYQLFFGNIDVAIANCEFRHIFNKIFNIIKNNSYDSLAITELSKIIFDIFLTASNNQKFDNRTKVINIENNQASRIKSYLCSHFKEKFSLDELSKIFSLSKNQIINTFNRSYKTTPQVFHMMQKIDVAEDMLKSGFSNKEIAEELNFYDEQYFSKMFYKYKKVLPKSIKKFK